MQLLREEVKWEISSRKKKLASIVFVDEQQSIMKVAYIGEVKSEVKKTITPANSSEFFSGCQWHPIEGNQLAVCESCMRAGS
nr:unnamed protein product [Haemonchus contortus]